MNGKRMTAAKEIREWGYMLVMPVLVGVLIFDVKDIKRGKNLNSVAIGKVETKSDRNELDIHAIYTKMDRLHPHPDPGENISRPNYMMPNKVERRKVRRGTD